MAEAALERARSDRLAAERRLKAVRALTPMVGEFAATLRESPDLFAQRVAEAFRRRQ